MRVSKAFMSEAPVADGSGIDMHLESTVEGKAPWAADKKPIVDGLAMGSESEGESQPVAFHHRAELALGPVFSKEYLNLTLPFGVLVGAVVDTEELKANFANDESPYGKAVQVYARLNVPGIHELRGWMWEGAVEDTFAGVIRAKVDGLWPKKEEQPSSPRALSEYLSWAVSGRQSWSIEHQRTHGLLLIPRFVVDQIVKMCHGLDSWPAAVPTTILRADSEGGAAVVSFESSRAALNGAGWGGAVEVTPTGWTSQLRIAGATGKETGGRPFYEVQAVSSWQEFPTVAHSVKYMLPDGQGVWARLTKGEKGPRLNMGMEIR